MFTHKFMALNVTITRAIAIFAIRCARENIELKMAAILSRPQCVNGKTCDYGSAEGRAIRSSEHLNKMNPRYFSPAATALKPQQIPMFLHNSARVWGRR